MSIQNQYIHEITYEQDAQTLDTAAFRKLNLGRTCAEKREADMDQP